jgi:glycine/D-amino acid oxidase-like deaminating enzyme
MRELDAVFVGGGIFGCALALRLKELGQDVLVVERADRLLTRASYHNQARVHNGYHYPRSLLTALRCRVNFPRFQAEYADCMREDFEKYYAVGTTGSKVTAAQFRQFCERIGAPLTRASADVRRLFNPDLVEDVFAVREVAFDAVRLRERVAERLAAAGIPVLIETEAVAVARAHGGGLELVVESAGGRETIRAREVLNCTYARLNKLLVDSGLEPLRLKHEVTEMPLVELPGELRGKAFTIMCGPFFSVMPFPPRGLFTLSHVRYTPHAEWHEGPGLPTRDPYEVLATAPLTSRYPHMVRDAARYLPALAGARRVDSLWEMKTVLPQSEVDDSRPVLHRKDCGLPGLTCILGGKIDNVYDIMDALTADDASPGIPR